MFRAVEIQTSLSTIPSNDASRAKLATRYHFVKFLICELIIVVIAGIAVPSLLWTHPTIGHALNARFPHDLRIAGITIRYSYRDIEFAILGALLGTAAAWKLYSPKKSADKAAQFFRHIYPQFVWSQEPGRNRSRNPALFSGS